MRSVLWVAAGALLILGRFILTVVLVAESKVVYRRYFGDYCLRISIGGDLGFDGTRHRTLVTSYYDPPQLVSPACGGTFRIPDSRKPEFVSVYDEPHSLFCVYDTNGWGYIAIVNTMSRKCYASAPLGYQTSDTIDWRDEYDLLKAAHPELPDVEVFAHAGRRENLD